MADAYGLIWPGESGLFSAYAGDADISYVVERYKVRRVPLMIETPKARRADDLHQVLKDLVALAKLAAAPLNTYQAAIRNADELLKQIERESTEETSRA